MMIVVHMQNVRSAFADYVSGLLFHC